MDMAVTNNYIHFLFLKIVKCWGVGFWFWSLQTILYFTQESPTGEKQGESAEDKTGSDVAEDSEERNRCTTDEEDFDMEDSDDEIDVENETTEK